MRPNLIRIFRDAVGGYSEQNEQPSLCPPVKGHALQAPARRFQAAGGCREARRLEVAAPLRVRRRNLGSKPPALCSVWQA